jgi:hypothetical protein
LEAFRALKFSRIVIFRALNPYFQIGRFKGPQKLFKMERFRALKLSRLENFRAPKPICQIGGFYCHKTLQTGEFKGPKISNIF